jgi:hypothetical protein
MSQIPGMSRSSCSRSSLGDQPHEIPATRMLRAYQAAVTCLSEDSAPCLALCGCSVAIAAMHVQATMTAPDGFDRDGLNDRPVAPWPMVLAFGEDRPRCRIAKDGKPARPPVAFGHGRAVRRNDNEAALAVSHIHRFDGKAPTGPLHPVWSCTTRWRRPGRTWRPRQARPRTAALASGDIGSRPIGSERGAVVALRWSCDLRIHCPEVAAGKALIEDCLDAVFTLTANQCVCSGDRPQVVDDNCPLEDAPPHKHRQPPALATEFVELGVRNAAPRFDQFSFLSVGVHGVRDHSSRPTEIVVGTLVAGARTASAGRSSFAFTDNERNGTPLRFLPPSAEPKLLAVDIDRSAEVTIPVVVRILVIVLNSTPLLVLSKSFAMLASWLMGAWKRRPISLTKRSICRDWSSLISPE